jgi:putative transposase
MAPRHLLRDLDGIYGSEVSHCLDRLNSEKVGTAPRSPWQSPYLELLIGSIRRACLDHVIVLHERHLRRSLTGYLSYYHNCRTHLSLDRNAPIPRKVKRPEQGKVAAIPQVGGLHTLYRRGA